MKKLHVSKDFALPKEIMTAATSLLAKRGAGKTYTAKALVEEGFAIGHPIVILDPVGVWWGLRASHDGKSPGLPFTIFGGEHGDVPIEKQAGELVANTVMEQNINAIIDLKSLRKNEQRQFSQDFIERLYEGNNTARLVVLEEADFFAPQKPMKGWERLLGACEDLVRRGRSRGLGVMMITQRSAVLNKDVLNQTDCMIAMRTTAPTDHSAIEGWVKYHGVEEEKKKFMASLPSLQTGQAWFIWPENAIFEQAQVRRIETFDSSATPEVGSAKPPAPKVLAKVEAAKLTDAMAALVEKVKREDPKELQRQVADLRRQLEAAKKATPATPPAKIKRVEVPVVPSGQAKRLESAATKLEATVAKAQEIAAKASESAKEIRATLVANLRAHGQPVPPAPAPQRLPSRSLTVSPPPSRAPRNAPAAAEGEVSLRAGERKMLQTLAQRHPLKLTRAQLGTLAGFTPSGGTFGTYFGTLKRNGFLTEASNGDVEVTAEGIQFLGSDVPPAPSTTQELLEMWRRNLRAGEAEMLDALVQVHPDGLTKDELGEKTGFTASGGTFGTYLGTLRRNGLVDVEGDQVRASDTLFITGRPA